MRVLVTGAGGYLGSVVCQLLLTRGFEVRGLDSLAAGPSGILPLLGQDGFEFVRADIRDRELVRPALAGVGAVVHLAAIVGDPACSQNPDLARAVNLEAPAALIADASSAGAGHFVFASTCSNYGRLPDPTVPAAEEHPLRPLSLYAETKVAIERELARATGPAMAGTTLRFATLYGLSPRMRFDLTVNQFVMEAVTNRRLVVFGEQFWRPYVHVRDAARAIAAVLESPAAELSGLVFNVGSTAENYRKLDLVELIRRQLGPFEVEFVSRAEDPRDYRVSFELIADRLGYQVTRTVPDGIAEIAAALGQGLLADPQAAKYHNAAPA